MAKGDFKKMMKQVDEREKRILVAAEIGRQIGHDIASKCKTKNGGISTFESSEVMSEVLHKVYSAEGDCAKLFVKWTIGKLYKKLWIRRFIPILNRIYDLFVENGITRKNPHSYGDLDGYMWYEKPKDCGYRVLIYTSHCACAEDSTYVFIWNDTTKHSLFSPVLHVRTLFDKSRKCYKGSNWGDCRDYDRMSLALFRKHNFDVEHGMKLGYGDLRDPNYVLSISGIGSSEDGAYTCIPKIEHAQWIVEYMQDEAEEIAAREEK